MAPCATLRFSSCASERVKASEHVRVQAFSEPLLRLHTGVDNKINVLAELVKP